MKPEKTIRLSVRTNEQLDKLIREEAERRGLTINQLMVSLLGKALYPQGSSIEPCSFS